MRDTNKSRNEMKERQLKEVSDQQCLRRLIDWVPFSQKDGVIWHVEIYKLFHHSKLDKEIELLM